MTSDIFSIKLLRIADEAGYHLEHRPTVYRRGWPEASSKPYALYFKDGSFLASFGSMKSLENALRARAGC